ncbi:hypothetical protein QBC34DRAFT_361252 [Podospora aff. communis PSN243]|uniref:Uncharacterized protein n=1 Tax=Podospora aff. communis PSN243 TaxID=3040156 RepID=A0AAV9G6Y6_9PEZI|nr:hypothetical protein QBC34DRAFT_361252 [Podospora aff. communis PSN243]
MEGLGALAGSQSEFPLKFQDWPGIKVPAVTIESTSHGLHFHRHNLEQHELRTFFQDDAARTYPLKLICVGINTRGINALHIGSREFADVLRGMSLDPWVEHFIRTQTHGFHHSGFPSTDGSASYAFKVRQLMAVWTCRWGPTGDSTAKCLILDTGMAPDSLLGDRIGLEKYLRAFVSDSQSALYVPFVLATSSLRWMEGRLDRILNVVRDVEERTGHGTWGAGWFREGRDSIPNLTAKLGTNLNVVAVLPVHLRTVNCTFSHMERLAGRGRESKSEHLQVREASMIRAIRILREECLAVTERCPVVETRVRSQSSVLFAFLTHEDSKINIEIANASKALTEATRQDGSSMKTIAVLTMAFLPATFLAALFSIPSLGWDQPDKFVLYWACVIPITVLTFALWALLTKRGAILGFTRALRMHTIPPESKASRVLYAEEFRTL